MGCLWSSSGAIRYGYGNDPADFTAENIANFKRQINALGFSYDWDREVNTTDPNYYKWTQWIFTKLYEKGLAYEAEVPVNWVEELGTAIANEEVLPDGTSERGGYPVVRKPMRQWMLKITAYAERLLNDLEDVDWPESIKDMQRNWIGKSTGANVTFKIKDTDKDFTVFTTRPDTLFGATYAVLAPEHDLVDTITSPEQAEAVAEYKRQASLKSDLARTDLAKDKTGVWTGAYAINPVNGREIPIWISDYVLVSYGTGAIMAVPAHDERDWEFAKQFGLDIIPVLEGGNVEEAPYTEDGLHINSDFLDGLNKEEAIAKMVAWLEENGVGQEKISYRLRDWLFSRQRYWGEPIPIIHWEDGTSTAVPENELPLVLPKTSDIKPSGTGESPLANLTDWLEVTREDGVKVAVKPTLCHNGRVLAGTTSAISTHTTMRNWQTRSFSKLGCQWTSTSVVPSMQSFTCFMLASGTSSSMTLALYRPKSHSKNSLTKG